MLPPRNILPCKYHERGYATLWQIECCLKYTLNKSIQSFICQDMVRKMNI
jgi:hypothetical protein